MWWKCLLLFFLIPNSSSGFLTGDALNRCCQSGQDYGANATSCSSFAGTIDNIPIEYQAVCLSTFGICCQKFIREAQCKLGEEAAKNGEPCIKDVDDFKTESYSDCCEACKIGMIMGPTSEKCQIDFKFGLPWDHSLESCCSEIRGEETYVIKEGTDICQAFPGMKLCEQICVSTDDSYYCKCNPGYSLLEDRVTCRKDPEEEVNEVDSNTSNSEECEEGYQMDEAGSCIDINECDSDEAKCDLDNEVCYNQPGKYMCIRINTDNECDEGLRYNTKDEICEDINECLEEVHNCTPEQYCINTRGSHRCEKIKACALGYRFDKHSTKCEDLNECIELNEICMQGFTCENTIGSYKCVGSAVLNLPNEAGSNTPPASREKVNCPAGFQRRLGKCIDINECITDRNACDRYQNCINYPGGFRCECKIGFTLDPLTNACVDVNECQINNHECLETQRCDNTIGSYNCIRLQGCGTGYTLNSATGECEDDDECILGTHNCVAPYECWNTVGSFRCHRARPTSAPKTTSSRIIQAITTPRPTYYYGIVPSCGVGFERNAQGACADINECDRHSPCRRNQRCINTNGSFKCENLLQCSGGYTATEDGSRCEDIDECVTQTANCGPDQLCRNKPGGYICYCQPGHAVSKDNSCEDIDECKSFKDTVCPVNADCFNTVGSYRCECKSGFRKLRDEDKVCVDIDECAEVSGLCEQKCINYWGSYRCACETGYKLSENNRTCDDLDECEIHKSYNLCGGICDNVPGSYRCSCPAGYKLGGDNRSCLDIDECEGGNVCRGHNEICTNIRGDYRCTRIDCPPDYTLDPEKKNRCKRISFACESEDMECLRKPLAYSYNYITLVSNMSVPPQGRGIFNFKGPNWYENIDFDYRIVNVEAPSNIARANEYSFQMTKMNNEALVSLMRTLEGPQDIELELSMTVYRNRMPSGTNVAKIYIIVSQYPY